MPRAASAEVKTIEIANDNALDQGYGQRQANKRWMAAKPGGKIERDLDGRNGSCMEVVNTATSCAEVYSNALIPVDIKNGTLKMSI